MPLTVKDVPLFQGLSDTELGFVKDCLHEKSFDKGEVLFYEGKPCERVFIVRSGRVKLYRVAASGKEQILETLGPGDTCACNPGVCNWHCGSTAEAITPCAVWFIGRDQYVRMIRTHSTLSHALNRLFADRISKFCSLIEEISLKDVKKRLVKLLLDMLETTSSSRGTNTKVLLVPFTREEIAQRIGTARETVARNLHQLKRSGLIDIKSRRIVIRDKEGLKKLL